MCVCVGYPAGGEDEHQVPHGVVPHDVVGRCHIYTGTADLGVSAAAAAAVTLYVSCRSCFQHYVLQDLFFLTRYARAYAAAIDKCTKPHHSAAKAVVAELLLGVDAELKLHGSYAAKWGVSVDEWVWPSAATSAYTDFLIDIAHDPEVRSSC